MDIEAEVVKFQFHIGTIKRTLRAFVVWLEAISIPHWYD